MASRQRRRSLLQQCRRHSHRLVLESARHTGAAPAACAGCRTTPALLNYGNMFTILPFGNATVVGKMTGAQILEVVNHGPNVAGVIQPAGLKYKYFSYKDANPGPQPYAWGAFDVCVVNKVTKACDPLDLKKTYNVGTNEFLAPAGGDGYNGFKYMTNITYWGDMLNAVNAYVSAQLRHGCNRLQGPERRRHAGRPHRPRRHRCGRLDRPDHHPAPQRLARQPGQGQLRRLHPAGDADQAGTSCTTPPHPAAQRRRQHPGRRDDVLLQVAPAWVMPPTARRLPPTLQINPLIAAFNTMGYDAMTLGNHEFNFGSDIFKGVMRQATFPVLGANVTDDGTYGLAAQAAQGQAVHREGPRRTASRSRSWASPTTACRTTSCPATSLA